MLTISPALAQAFETGTLLRWKQDIASTLRTQYPDAAARFPGMALEDWVQGSMDTLRRLGASTKPDLELFTLTLFRLTEAEPDPIAAGDFTAIMVAPTAYPAKMALLRKAFG